MSFERKQFTFYRSFYEAMQKLPAKKREKLAMFIIEYALNETEPNTKDSTLLATFAIIRPILDSGRIKSQSGKMGGSISGESRKANTKQNEAKLKQYEANPKQEKVQEQVQEQVQGEEQEQGQCSPEESDLSVFAPVFEAMRRCEVFMEDKDKAECERLCAEYGARAVIEAIDRAKEQNVPRWPYIRKIVTSGGVSQRGGKPKSGYIHHGDPPTPAMLDAVRQMLAEPDDAEEGVAHE